MGGLYFSMYLPRELRRLKPDLYWGSQQVAPLFLPEDMPVVLTYCDLVLYLYPDTMRKIAAIQQKFYQGYSVKKAKFILSISEQTRADLLKKFPFIKKENTGVAYPGVTQKEIQLLLEESDPIPGNIPDRFLLSVSTIEPRKNYPFLLEVYKNYRNIAGNHKLPWVIVGKIGWESGDFIEKLNYEISKHGDIFLINSASDVVLHKLYKKSEIFLFASIYEGFGIPLLEALAHRKKCLVSDIPTFREIGGNSIPYLQSHHPEIWAEKILELQENQMSPLINLDDFSWEKSAIETENAFNKVLNDK